MIDIKDNNKIPLILILNYISVSARNNSLIYILTWATSHLTPVPDTDEGQQYFINMKCLFQNCFLTNNQSYFKDETEFDVILFHAVIVHEPDLVLPSARLENQKYIFMSNEPSVLYPIPSHYNGFFNYTFTYVLSSDSTWRFFIVKDKDGKIVAPKYDVNWIDYKSMDPISDEIKLKLQNKIKAAAWFVSHCETPSQRETYVRKLNDELDKYKLTIDIFGDCGNLHCTNEQCPLLIETDYYFYLVFENSMCRDYVTEKVLVATKHFAVPIVYGGANYSRYAFDIKISLSTKAVDKESIFIYLKSMHLNEN